MIEMRVGKILKRKGVIFHHPKKSLLPLKIIPINTEDDEKIIQRQQILKSHQTFQNEIHNQYTNNYLKTFFSLLNKNEKNYHIKRNKLSFSTLHQWDKENNCPNNQSTLQSNNHYYHQSITIPIEANDVIQSPQLTTGKHKTFSSKDNMRRVLLGWNNSNESLCGSHQGHLSQSDQKVTRNLCIKREIIKKSTMKERYFKGFSQDNMKLLELIDKSDKCMKIHQENAKERMIRRFNGIGNYYNMIETPKKMKDYQAKIFRKEDNVVKRTTVKNMNTTRNVIKKEDLRRSFGKEKKKTINVK